MPSVNTDIELRIFCDCGEDLTRKCDAENKRGEGVVTVPVCQVCTDKAFEEGVKEGREQSERAEL